MYKCKVLYMRILLSFFVSSTSQDFFELTGSWTAEALITCAKRNNWDSLHCHGIVMPQSTWEVGSANPNSWAPMDNSLQQLLRSNNENQSVSWESEVGSQLHLRSSQQLCCCYVYCPKCMGISGNLLRQPGINFVKTNDIEGSRTSDTSQPQAHSHFNHVTCSQVYSPSQSNMRV